MPNNRTGRPNLDWQQDAACYNNKAFLELPEHGGWTDRQRLRLCNGHTVDDQVIEPGCPVINQCLDYALTLPATDVGHRGIVFGGHTIALGGWFAIAGLIGAFIGTFLAQLI